MNEETLKAIHNITEQTITAYQNQNQFTVDSSYTSNNVFDVFNENIKTFASMSKNIIEVMLSTMKKT